MKNGAPLFNMKLTAIPSSYQSSNFFKIIWKSPQKLPRNLRPVCSFSKRTPGIFLPHQTPEFQYKVSLHFSRRHTWEISRHHSRSWWRKLSCYNGEEYRELVVWPGPVWSGMLTVHLFFLPLNVSSTETPRTSFGLKPSNILAIHC